MLRRTKALGVTLALLCGCPDTDAAASASRHGSPGGADASSNLASDEHVLLVPTFGTRSADGWHAPVEAWVFEPEEDGPVRAGMVKLVEEAMQTQLDDEAAARVATNIRPFMVDNERGKTLVVQAADVAAPACTSKANGHCAGTLTLASDAHGTVPVAVLLPSKDRRRFEGRVHLLEDEGVSVLSDIDDTIKVTEVHDKKRLVANTFARPFRATAGVPELYRRWARQGAAFHYVSNSPLPLLGALERFIEDEGYPKGSVTLKMFRWVDGSFLDLLDAPENHKQAAIEAHIDRFESRRFVLVGDTGERDPEIYAAVARKYGDRIARVYLRDTGSMSADALEARLDAVYEGLPAQRWTVFTDGSEIHDDLPSSSSSP